MITILKSILGVLTGVYGFAFFRDLAKNRTTFSKVPWWGLAGTGFLTNALDTLGIGSFAQQTALFKFFKLVDDRVIPGTLNVGNVLPTIAQAFIFMTAVEVAPLTLVCMAAAAPIGAVLGAGVVSHWPKRRVELGLGLALLAVAAAMLVGLLNWFPIGGVATGLTGWKLVLATAVSFGLGAIHTLGVGFYAPCMALVYSLGMNPRVAFPIMMTSTAMLISAAGLRFIREKAHDRKACLNLAVFGVLGVLLAAFVIVSLPLLALKWVVLAVVLYTSLVMLRSSRHAEARAADEPEAEAGPTPA
jgi:uncharacterized membrane protein YfcA